MDEATKRTGRSRLLTQLSHLVVGLSLVGNLLGLEHAAARVKRPDLVVTLVANPPNEATLAGTFRLSSTVKNRGRKRAPSSTNHYYLSRDSRRNRNDIRLLGKRTVPALAPNDTSTGRVRLTIPQSAPVRAYFVIVCADGPKEIREPEESNNCRASSQRMSVDEGHAASIANQILALDQRVPDDVNIFTSVFNPGQVDGLYPDGAAMEPAPGPVLTEEQVRVRLTAFLSDWYDNNSGKVSDALELFDDDHVKTMIPDPDNRAAFVSLNGTIWEPLVVHFLNSGLFNPSRYGGLPITILARSALIDDKFTIIFNVRHNSEDFANKIGVWVHEIGHDDGPVTGNEESVLHAVMSMAQMQVLLKNPRMAYENTELTRFMDSYVLQFINSREDGSPNSEIFAPTGQGTAPGSAQSKPDFRTVVGGSDGSTPAPAAFSEILTRLGLPASSQYNQPMAESFESLNDDWMSDQQRVQISVLLQLVSVEEISQETGLSQQAAIDLLELQPYLDAIDGG